MESSDDQGDVSEELGSEAASESEADESTAEAPVSEEEDVDPSDEKSELDMPDAAEVEEEGYEVEKVIRHWSASRQLKFEVKWRGFDKSANTEEPLDNIDETAAFHHYVTKIKKGGVLKKHCKCEKCNA